MTRYPPGPLAISIGDPAGIGAEVIAKCWDNRGRFELPADRLGHKEQTLKIDIEDRIPIRFTDVKSAAANIDAGIVHQDVDPTERINSRINALLN